MKGPGIVIALPVVHTKVWVTRVRRCSTSRARRTSPRTTRRSTSTSSSTCASRQHGREGRARGRGLPQRSDRACDHDPACRDRRHPARRCPLARDRINELIRSRLDQETAVGHQGDERRDSRAHAAARDPGCDEPADVAERVRRAVVLEADGRSRRTSRSPKASSRRRFSAPRATSRPRSCGRRVRRGAPANLRGRAGNRREDDDAPVPDTLKALGASPSSKFLFPLEFTRLLEGLVPATNRNGARE